MLLFLQIGICFNYNSPQVVPEYLQGHGVKYTCHLKEDFDCNKNVSIKKYCKTQMFYNLCSSSIKNINVSYIPLKLFNVVIT